MKPRTTLTLLAIGGAFFGYIWFVERNQKTTRELADTTARVVEIEQSKISGISIKNSETSIELSKKDGIWKIEQPLSDRADPTAISQLLSMVETLRHDSRIDFPSAQAAEKLKEFGVTESDLRLKLKSDSGKETELLLGNDSAIEGKVYVRVNGSDTVYVVRNALRNQVTKKVEDFRDKKLADTAPSLVSKVQVKTAEGEFELERKNTHWDFVRPLRARAADQKVNDLLAGVLNAQVSQFLAEAPTPEQALSEPRATVTMSVEGEKEPLVLLVGAAPTGDDSKDRSFAKLSSRAAVTVLSNAALDPLIKARPNDLRDRKLIRVASDIVDRITIEPHGRPKIVIARKGENWVLKNGESESAINEILASKLLADFQSAEATNFVADVAADLSQYHLSEPSLRVTLSSYASENTAETKAGEKVLAKLLFGPIEGDNAYCKLDDEPFVVAASKNLIGSIPTDAILLQPLDVMDFNPEDVVKISSRKGSDTTVLEKQDGVWKIGSGEGSVNLPAVQAMLSLVGHLRTPKWIGPTDPVSQGLEKPEFELNFESKKGDQTSSLKLSVGSPYEGENALHATVSSKPGTFSLNKADKDILSASLLHQP
jgi:hypothetical protein